MHPRARHILAGLPVLSILAVAAVSAQSESAPAPDPVLAEMRALRADLNERLAVGIRAQLLVARLQVQEQRTRGVIQQLQDVTARRRENASTRSQLESRLKAMGADTRPASPNEAGLFVTPLLAGLEQLEKTDAALAQEEAELTAFLAAQQTRWATFNSQLEEIERMFAKSPR